MKNNIGIIAYGLNRATGGIGRYTQELLTALRKADADITVFETDRTGEPNHILLPGTRLLPGLLTLGQVQIARAAQSQRLTLVHDPTGVVPLAFTHTRRVATIHDVIPYVYPHTSTLLDQVIYRFWLPFAVRGLDAIITDSTQSKADIVRYLLVQPEKIAVVPLAASSRYCLLDQETVHMVLARHNITTSYILYVGAIESRKNLPRLLEAYARVREWSSRWTLVVVGAYKWKYSSVFETVMRLGLENHIHFTGFIPEEDLPALYNGADLFVFPSLYEGFGLPVLEAMACGTPVVTSNVSSLPEVAGNAAILVDPYNIDELADAMRRVLSTPLLAADLRARGLERAQQYSWERTVHATLEVYKNVLQKTN